MVKKYYAKEETLEKVRQLDGKKLINKDGQNGGIWYIMRVKPFSKDYKEGDLVVLKVGEEEWSYLGEEGLQMLLENWEVVDE